MFFFHYIGVIAFVVLFSGLACSPRQTVPIAPPPSSSPSPLITGPRKKLAVTRFSVATRFGERRLGENVTAILITELNQTGQFILLERERVAEVLEQLALSQSGVTQGTLQQLQLLDADYIVTGAVTHYSVTIRGSSGLFSKRKIQQAKVVVDVRLVDVRTGAIIFSASGEGSAQREYRKVLGVGTEGGYDEALEMEALRSAVRQLVRKIVATLAQRPFICDVVKVQGRRLYIDAGKRSHLPLGQTIVFYHRGDPIVAPDGRLLGYEETRVATGKVVQYIGEDAAVVVIDHTAPLPFPLIGKIESGEQP